MRSAIQYDDKLVKMDTNFTQFRCSTKVWDLRCQMAVRTCIGHQKPITSNAILPDGKTVISGSLDAQCRFYDASSVFFFFLSLPPPLLFPLSAPLPPEML